MKRLKLYLSAFKKAIKAWWKSDPFRQSAIIAYYAIFSIPALLVIVIACAGLVFGQEAVQGEVSKQISTAMDDNTARQVEEMIAKAGEQKSSGWAAALGVVTLIFGATGVFAQMQISLNQIWKVKAKPKKAWLKTIKNRLFSFGLIVSIGFLLLISLLVSAGLSSLGEWMRAQMPDALLFLFHVLNFIVSLAVISVLFALMFKILPDVRLRWKDVWVGSIVTALLFTLGKTALGIYFGKAEPASTYGAAGSVVLIMLWVSYSCMIVFLGAEFTRQNALSLGHSIEPKDEAELIEPKSRRIWLGTGLLPRIIKCMRYLQVCCSYLMRTLCKLFPEEPEIRTR
jgi:membrane protein